MGGKARRRYPVVPSAVTRTSPVGRMPDGVLSNKIPARVPWSAPSAQRPGEQGDLRRIMLYGSSSPEPRRRYPADGASAAVHEPAAHFTSGPTRSAPSKNGCQNQCTRYPLARRCQPLGRPVSERAFFATTSGRIPGCRRSRSRSRSTSEYPRTTAPRSPTTTSSSSGGSARGGTDTNSSPSTSTGSLAPGGAGSARASTACSPTLRGAASTCCSSGRWTASAGRG